MEKTLSIETQGQFSSDVFSETKSLLGGYFGNFQKERGIIVSVTFLSCKPVSPTSLPKGGSHCIIISVFSRDPHRAGCRELFRKNVLSRMARCPPCLWWTRSQLAATHSSHTSGLVGLCCSTHGCSPERLATFQGSPHCWLRPEACLPRLSTFPPRERMGVKAWQLPGGGGSNARTPTPTGRCCGYMIRNRFAREQRPRILLYPGSLPLECSLGTSFDFQHHETALVRKGFLWTDTWAQQWKGLPWEIRSSLPGVLDN